MARILGQSESNDNYINEVFANQELRWGERLAPYEIYAHRPSIFRSVVGMWNGIGESGLIEDQLAALVNRRVAAINGCVF